MNKTGIFYDEKLYSEMPVVEDSKNEKNTEGKEEGKGKGDPFAEFDFDEVKEFEKDERDLNHEIEKQSQVNIKYSIVCDSVP